MRAGGRIFFFTFPHKEAAGRIYFHIIRSDLYTLAQFSHTFRKHIMFYPFNFILLISFLSFFRQSLGFREHKKGGKERKLAIGIKIDPHTLSNKREKKKEKTISI